MNLLLQTGERLAEMRQLKLQKTAHELCKKSDFGLVMKINHHHQIMCSEFWNAVVERHLHNVHKLMRRLRGEEEACFVFRDELPPQCHVLVGVHANNVTI
jgi:hypothetical protein